MPALGSRLLHHVWGKAMTCLGPISVSRGHAIVSLNMVAANRSGIVVIQTWHSTSATCSQSGLNSCGERKKQVNVGKATSERNVPYAVYLPELELRAAFHPKVTSPSDFCIGNHTAQTDKDPRGNQPTNLLRKKTAPPLSIHDTLLESSLNAWPFSIFEHAALRQDTVRGSEDATVAGRKRYKGCKLLDQIRQTQSDTVYGVAPLEQNPNTGGNSIGSCQHPNCRGSTCMVSRRVCWVLHPLAAHWICD